ncbi:MAG: hydroxymethylbilane synthase [Chitinophagales bacterium]
MKGKSSPLIIGTRGSELALWQANFTKSVLESNGFLVELKIIKTKGDATQQWNLSFDKIEGKGFFTKELEDALLAGEIDLAVHSCKDLPTEFPEGLTIAAYSKRANPFDILLIRKQSKDETKVLKLKSQAKVGTSSARRKAQLLALRPDIEVMDLRGNVPTRVNKLNESQYDAIVLAFAGLERLNINLDEFEKVSLKAPMFIPAPAQGVLAFQIREADGDMRQICTLLNDEESSLLTNIERKLLHDFEGGCQMPLGVYAERNDNMVDVWVSQADSWNSVPKRMHKAIPADDQNYSTAIVSKMKNIKTSTVFISSELKEDDYLKRVLEAHRYTVSSGSLIEFTPVDFDFPNDANWLFFSSKNGVKFFFEKAGRVKLPNTKLAAINQGTAQAIFELGYAVDFIGTGGDLAQIAAVFEEVASGKIVFPQAKQSMQSIQKKLSKHTDIEALVVYENKPQKMVKERAEDILVFTSPMSAQAYFTLFGKKENQTVISIGKTTTKKLNEFNVNGIITAFEPTPWALMDEIFAQMV